MSRQRRLLSLFGVAAGAVVAAAVVPMAVAYADDCASGECTLVADPPLGKTDGTYAGFRPLFTDWQANQPVNVEVTPADGSSFVSGSYDVSEEDYRSPIVDSSIYHYGDFTPAANNTSGIDSDGLSGVTAYYTVFGPITGETAHSDRPTGAVDHLSVSYPNGTYVDATTIGDTTNVLESTSHGSADFVYSAGQANPTMLWDSLPDFGSPPSLQDLFSVLPPDTWGGPGLQ